jgi:hypothetical protein
MKEALAFNTIVEISSYPCGVSYFNFRELIILSVSLVDVLLMLLSFPLLRLIL